MKLALIMLAVISSVLADSSGSLSSSGYSISPSSELPSSSSFSYSIRPTSSGASSSLPSMSSSSSFDLPSMSSSSYSLPSSSGASYSLPSMSSSSSFDLPSMSSSSYSLPSSSGASYSLPSMSSSSSFDLSSMSSSSYSLPSSSGASYSLPSMSSYSSFDQPSMSSFSYSLPSASGASYSLPSMSSYSSFDLPSSSSVSGGFWPSSESSGLFPSSASSSSDSTSYSSYPTTGFTYSSYSTSGSSYSSYPTTGFTYSSYSTSGSSYSSYPTTGFTYSSYSTSSSSYSSYPTTGYTYSSYSSRDSSYSSFPTTEYTYSTSSTSGVNSYSSYSTTPTFPTTRGTYSTSMTDIQSSFPFVDSTDASYSYSETYSSALYSSATYETTTTSEPTTTAFVDGCAAYSPCLNGATCTTGATSGAYNCTCATGYSGDTCTEEKTIMPYADADYSVTGDDSLSDGVYLPGGMPFGSEDVQRLFVSTNGFVVFDHRYYGISPSTSSFPAPYGKPLIAPYWTDLDARYTNVKFDVYHDRTSKTNQDYIMAALGNYVKNFNSSYSSFSPNLAVVVTWPEVPPYPAFTYSGIESATIQLSLVSDGTDSFAIFNYYNMTLTPTTFWRQVGIGYTSSSQYGASFYEKNALSFTTDSYSIDTIAGNTGVAGKWIYKINSASSGSFTPAQMCFSWQSQQTALIARNTCPNTLSQAMVDIRYMYYYNAAYNMDASVPCFIQRFMRYDWASGQWIREMCCYDMIYGSLETVSPNAGSAMSSFIDDLTGKSFCCVQSNYCHLYYEMRPISYSTSYRRMFFTWMWGDPHIGTLDGSSYTFNGIGEYLMLQTTDTTTMIIQARMEVAESGANATIFSSFVVQSNQSDIVQVNLNQARDAMLIYVNGGAYNYTIADLANETEHLGVSLSNTVNGSLQITFETGFGVEFKIGYKALEAAVQAPNGYEGLIEGLLGNYDSDSTNDYVFRNGTMISSNSSERELYAFGKTWQLTSEADSKFTYFGNESFVGFYNVSAYTPVFADEYTGDLLSLFNNDTSLLAAANSTCTGIADYMQCMFDAARMGTVNAAENAVSHTEDADNQENTMSNNPPTFSTMNSTLTLYLNSTSNLTLNATDPEGGNVTFQLSGNSTDVATIDDVSDTLSITPGGSPFFITVLAADSAGSSSSWQPNVYVCDCLNGGACDFSYVDETYSESNSANYYGADCTCINGYDGDKCEISPCDADPFPCYEGVVCSLVNGSVNCGACPSGLEGNGTKCFDVDECIETPTICEDVCTNTMFSYSCSCTQAGFEVSTANSSLCVDVNECAYGLDDCNATLGEICVNTAGNYSCECDSGYERNADNYCIDIDECTVGSHDCDANANCTNNAGSWSCSCNSGYNGNGTSCSDTDECANSALNDCQMFCNNTVGSFNCSCTSGYELNNDGISCIVAAGSECSGGNTCNQLCAIQNGVDTCSCYSGYELDSMDNTTCIDINECNLVGNPCTHICTNKIDGYACSCNSSGYSLANDGYTCENIDECTLGTSNCAANTSTCTDNDGSYSCACNSGYSGDGTSCTDIDECAIGYCLANANCFNYPGSYKCQCKLGYYGDPYTACSLATYAFTGTFSLTATFDSALSDTTTTAYHTLAQTIEDTLYSHFLTYFAATFKNATMIGFSAGSTVASFSLTFGAGTSSSSPTSSSVSTTLGTLASSSGGSCFVSGIGSSVCSSASSSDFDECSNNAYNCTASNTECSNTVGSYDCVCVSGYTSTGTDADGNPICVDVNECLSTCTLANSECANSIGSYTCSCASGYVSSDPENVACYDACDSSPCQNGGACQSDSSQSSGYTCICPSGYSGDNCETYENVTTSTIVAIVVGSVLGILAFILITILVILRVTGKLPCLRPKKTIEPMGLVNEDPVVSMSSQNRGFTMDSYTRESDTPVTQREVSLHGYPSEKAMYVENMIRQHPAPMVPTTAAATVADGSHPMPKMQQFDTTLSGSSGMSSSDTGYGEDTPVQMSRGSTQVDERPNTGRAASAGKQGSIAAGAVVPTGNVGRGSASTQGRPSSSNRRTSHASGKVEQHSPDVASTPVGTKTESALGQGGSGSLLPTENEPNLFEVRGNVEVRIPSANANAAQSTRPGSGTSIVSVTSPNASAENDNDDLQGFQEELDEMLEGSATGSY